MNIGKRWHDNSEPKPPVDSCEGGGSYRWGTLTLKLPTVVLVLSLSLLVFRTVSDDIDIKGGTKTEGLPFSTTENPGTGQRIMSGQRFVELV